MNQLRGDNSFVAENIDIADMDGDEDKDIVVASSGRDELKWYENEIEQVGIENEEPAMPTEIKLKQNYPNPFNPSTQISFRLPEKADVQLAVYDVTGRRITTLVSRKLKRGNHTVTFYGSGLSSGMYMYRLKADNLVKSRKMLLVK